MSKKRPLTIPVEIEVDSEGIEWLTFVYTSKGISTDYRIRVDVDHINPEQVPKDFMIANSVYPKAAGVTRQEYRGNRWDYETSVNDIGWKLCHLNEFLIGKRGLLQRAVDSYRNTKNESKSRRVARVEKTLMEKNGELPDSPTLGPRLAKKKKRLNNEKTDPLVSQVLALSGYDAYDNLDDDNLTMKRSSSSPARFRRDKTSSGPKTIFSAPPYNDQIYHTLPSPPPRSYTSSPKAQDSRQRLIVETVKNSAPYQFRLRMDIDSIPSQVDRSFVLQNQVYSKPKSHRDFLCNSIAWKLAYLNPQILHGNLELLQRSVDIYMEHFEEPGYCPRPGLRLMAQVFGDGK